MFEKYFSIKESEVSKVDFIAFSFLLLNAISWYFMSLSVLDGIFSSFSNPIWEKVIVNVSFYSAIIISSFCGVLFASKIRRRYLLLIWVIFGIIASFLPLIVITKSTETLIFIFSWFGFSFGFGMPSCLSYFADGTVFENRGRSGGLIFFLANLSAFAFIIFDILVNNLTIFLMYMVVWRGLSLFIFKLPLKKVEGNKPCYTSFKRIFKSKSFLFYLVPWLMFSLVDSLEKVYLQSYIQISFGKNFFELNQLVESIIGAFSAIFVGMLGDFIGRKRMVIYGFISLGIAYSLIGLAPFLEVFWYFYSFIDGIAWGIFLIMFTLVIWGDLSPVESFREKYYVIGSVPLFASKLIGTIFSPYAQAFSAESAYAAFSLAAFFLFLAVIPLMYAPETLPEKKIRERELKKYIEKAKKIKEKYVKE